MGKSRKVRLSKKRQAVLSQEVIDVNDKKVTLTRKQLNDMFNRVRLNQMQLDGIERKKIMSTLGISKDTYARWQGIGFDDISVYIEAPRTGRPETAIDVEEKILEQRENEDFSLRTTALQLGVSYQTVANILYDAELKWKVRPKATKLSKQHKKNRLEFCKLHKNEPLSWWDKILVADSKIFTLEGGRNPRHHGRWVYDDEEVESWDVEKFSKSLHVYGGMTSKGLTPLVFVEGSITGDRYVEEILPTLIGVQTRKRKTNDVTTTKLFDDSKDWIFEQDHARCHDSNIVQDYLLENVPEFFGKSETPAKLDDLWCIERIWAVMTYKVYGKGQGQPKTLEELKQRIVDSWKSLEVKMLRKAVHQMPLRMKQIVENKGARVVRFK